jgi:chromosome partitioning protein
MAKISLAYKKDGRLNGASLSLTKKIIQALGVNEKDNNIVFEYRDKKIFLIKGRTELEEERKNSLGEFLFLKKNHTIKFTKIKNSYITKVSIPISILGDFGITEKDKEVSIEIEKDKICIKKEVKIMGDKNFQSGKIITVKVNKGGVGKTFITTQLAAALAAKGFKTLILTSDSQNNVSSYLTPRVRGEKPKLEFKSGLKSWVSKGEGDIFKLRENLYFIPLENNIFGAQFVVKLPIFLEKMKEEYDYIFIDSIPTIKIDTTFVENSDKVIIPCFADEVTVEGVINVIYEAGAEKVLAIIVNKYEDKKIQKLYLEKIEEAIKNTDIVYPIPIKNSSDVQTLLYNGKTVWESKSKSMENIKSSFNEVIDKLILMKLGIEEESDEFDF